MKRSPEGEWVFTPEEIAEKEKRNEMLGRLNKFGNLVLNINGDRVVVTRKEGKFEWQAGGATHRSDFWPDEKLGTIGEYPTFYQLSKEAGRLEMLLPPAEQWRRLKSRKSNP